MRAFSIESQTIKVTEIKLRLTLAKTIENAPIRAQIGIVSFAMRCVAMRFLIATVNTTKAMTFHFDAKQTYSECASGRSSANETNIDAAEMVAIKYE